MEIIILLVILLLLIIFINNKKKEFFAEFINYTDSKLPISDRAIYDDNILDLKINPVLPLDNSIDINYSLIKHNLITYVFKKCAFYFKIKSLNEKNNNLDIIIDISNKDDRKNLINLFLLNTEYVEFISNNIKSRKYRLDILSFSSYDISSSNTFKLLFVNANNENNKNFKFNKSELKFYAYFVDNFEDSYQNIARFLPAQKVNNNSIEIYNKNFDNININEKSFHFMNLFRQMYLSMIVPDIVFNFDIIVNNNFNNINNQLLNCIINNGKIGGSSSDCKNNLLSCSSVVSSNFINLNFVTGDNVDCGFNNINNPILTIKIPKITSGTKISITIMLSSYLKLGFAKWIDINTDSYKHVSYNQTPFKLQNNYFIDIFNKKYPLENTTLKWNTSYIYNQPSVILGYINLLTKFNEI